MRPEHHDWPEYLRRFHQSRPGITEDILARSKSGGIRPYEWLREVLPPMSRTLDLACGSAPLLGDGSDRPWVGIDRSAFELDVGKNRARGRLIQADASMLPFASASFEAVACSMALMLLEPLASCMSEIARVLVPGGRLVALVPGGPARLSGRDIGRWARLFVALRVTGLRYPNDAELADLPGSLGPKLVVVADERRRFGLTFEDIDSTDRFVDSLYLPDVSVRSVDRAKRVACGWVHRELGIPIRRIHIEKSA